MQEIRQAAEGTMIVMSFMKRGDLEAKAAEEEIAKMIIPLENLSKREYIPKTIAPFLLLVPITSEIKLTPVDRVID